MRLGGFDIESPLVLAPMAGVTDRAFRDICRQLGADYTVTEMVSTRAIFHGDRKSAALMELSADERPGGVQLFGGEPGHFYGALELAAGHKADVIDINMGCPTPKIVKNGDGCALMRDMKKAAAILRACADASPAPVSVKFRKGWDENSINAVEFAKMAEQCGAAFITVHGRTCRQMYACKADWDIIARVKKAVNIPVIGNGDVTGGESAVRLLRYTGCDGVMIGRAALGNPWVFREVRAAIKGLPRPAPPDIDSRIETALRHVRLIVEYKGAENGIRQARKHLSWYMKGLRGAGELKRRACSVFTMADVELLLESAFDKNRG